MADAKQPITEERGQGADDTFVDLETEKYEILDSFKTVMMEDPEDNTLQKPRMISEAKINENFRTLKRLRTLDEPNFWEYSFWGHKSLWAVVFTSAILLILTLTQEHDAKEFGLPLDLVPVDKFQGGWPNLNNEVRLSGSLLGLVSCAFFFVQFVWMEKESRHFCCGIVMFTSSILLLAAFAKDTDVYAEAKQFDACRNGNKEFICKMDRFLAVVCLDLAAGIVLLVTFIWVVFNTCAGNYYVPESDEDLLLPEEERETQDQKEKRELVQKISYFGYILGAILNIAIVVCSVTQFSPTEFVPAGKEFKVHNIANKIPADIYTLNQGGQFRQGGWPTYNYLWRTAVALCHPLVFLGHPVGEEVEVRDQVHLGLLVAVRDFRLLGFRR